MINNGYSSQKCNSTCDETCLRDTIQESWSRCRCSELDRNDFSYQTPPGLRELLNILEDNRILIKSSIDAIDNLSDQCKNHDYITCIFNNKGILLYFKASEGLEGQMKNMNIFVGASWSEENMGTNSAGTVLECRQSVIIYKDEHYFKNMCKYTWIGVPIKGRDGDIAGVVCAGFEDMDILPFLYDKILQSVRTIEGRLYLESGCTVENQHSFFSEIVHESRNALTACEGFIQFMLIKRIFNSEYLEIVLSELRRATEILNSYNFVSSTHRNIEYCNLNNCIKEINTLLSSKLNFRNIDLTLSLSEIPEILLDSSRIKQILLNMIENSIDAIGKEGSIEITTCCSHDSVIMTIKDTGCGIDPSIKEKVFTPFFTTKSKGTGLGLHVCKSIIESYRGKIELESLTGRGTTFTITFPIDKRSSDYN